MEQNNKNTFKYESDEKKNLMLIYHLFYYNRMLKYVHYLFYKQ
jgi:hypothetical protein